MGKFILKVMRFGGVNETGVELKTCERQVDAAQALKNMITQSVCFMASSY